MGDSAKPGAIKVQVHQPQSSQKQVNQELNFAITVTNMSGKTLLSTLNAKTARETEFEKAFYYGQNFI